MDAPTAQQIASQRFARLKEIGEEIVVELQSETPCGWILYYQSAQFLQTRDPHDCVVGNGPMIVMKDTGAIYFLPTGGWDAEIKYFEATHFAPEKWPAEQKHEYRCIRFVDAACYGKLNVLQDCLDDGVFIEEQDTVMRMTALQRAMMTGRKDTVAFLLNAGADVNRQDEWGQTALMMAVRHSDSDADTVRLLLQWGADMAARDKEGRTALSLSSTPDITRMLRRAILKRGWQILVRRLTHFFCKKTNK